MTSASTFHYHPTVVFDGPYWVHDFQNPVLKLGGAPHLFGGPLRRTPSRDVHHRTLRGVRNHHVGLDLGGPVHTPIHAFGAGEIAAIAINDEDGSYGPTLITSLRYVSQGRLADRSGRSPNLLGAVRACELGQHAFWKEGDQFDQGEVLAAMGTESENGGWPPPCMLRWLGGTRGCSDLPGVLVCQEDRLDALERFSRPSLDLRAALLNAVQMGLEGVDGTDGCRVFAGDASVMEGKSITEQW